MLDVALQRIDGTTVVDPQLLQPRASVPLPVIPALQPVLPDGLRRGSTVSVTNKPLSRTRPMRTVPVKPATPTIKSMIDSIALLTCVTCSRKGRR